MPQRGFMKSTSLNVVGKLPQGLVALYQKINVQTEALGIPYLVIGATARDIILHHGYGAAIERGTRDIDFGIQVQNWDQFEQLKEHLLNNGFTPDQTKVHQLVTTVPNGENWEIDIIPFGNIAGDGNAITWPPQHDIGMSVTGFNEAFKHALDVKIAINPNLNIKVASPAGMLLLKLISWLEREHGVRRKDAMDIFYLTRHYSKIPDIADSLYEDDFMDVQDYDEHKASTMKLATDACNIANAEVLSFINEKLFNVESKVDNLVLDISRAVQIEYSDAEALLSIISKQLNTS